MMFVTILTIIYLSLAIFIFARYIRKVMPKIRNRMNAASWEMIKNPVNTRENIVPQPADGPPSRSVHEE